MESQDCRLFIHIIRLEHWYSGIYKSFNKPTSHCTLMPAEIIHHLTKHLK